MYKILHRLFHIPCVILMVSITFIARSLIAMHDFWQNRKEDIVFFAHKMVYAAKLVSVIIPLFIIFSIVMVQLS